MNVKRTLVSAALIGVASLYATSSQAAWIDFTSADWSGAQGQNSITQNGVTVSSTGGSMTFNGSGGERSGCEASWGLTDNNLACAGDGIGISNDEVTGNANQSLTVEFDSLVDIIEIELLDLFQDEGPEGADEVAIINTQEFSNTSQVVGGYLATGFQAEGVTTLTLTAQNDSYSDYSLARITTVEVAEPTSFALFGLGLIGMGVLRRKARSS